MPSPIRARAPGSLAAAALAILPLEHVGWRGMLLLGAPPFMTLLPLAPVEDAPSPSPGSSPAAP